MKINLRPWLIKVIKYTLRRQWGRYRCFCDNDSKKALGLTANLGTGEVKHFWCSDCGGYREVPGKCKIEIENTSVKKCGGK